ncbi:MAG: chalcone isomerase family protein [Betaproteobacteria bacterium]|nr:chalcone isomerase family protein [Betaproteobacteria bacterium]
MRHEGGKPTGRAALAGLMLALGFSVISAPAAEVEGVKLADKIRLEDAGPELVLNGAGVRTRLFFKVYVGALYLPRKQADPATVIADAGPKRVAMHMLRELGAEQLFAALNDGLKNNHAPAQLAQFEAQTKQLEAIFNAVKVARPGDVILIDHLPGSGTRVKVNDETRGVIPGTDFNRALLRIWLGEDPADSGLKNAMLGG